MTATTQAAQAAYYGSHGWHATTGYDGKTEWSYVKADGTQASYKWLWINGAWYYFKSNGDMAADGWHGAPWHDDYNDYYFDANGHYVTNSWHAEKNGWKTAWTYSKGDGTQAHDEWLWINGAWYYFKSNGDMAADGWHEAPWHDDYNDYYFDANGHYVTNCWHSRKSGWKTIWTYSKGDGTQAHDEWLRINGAWYYFKSDGDMAAYGTHFVPWNGSDDYRDVYFDANGHY